MTGWNVLAESDRTLTDLTTGKSLYSLYYESTNTYNFEVTNEGFIVNGDKIIIVKNKGEKFL